MAFCVFGFGHALAQPAHDAFAADHGVCDGAGAIALWENGLFAHGAEAAVVAEEGVDAFWVEDVVAGEFADDGAGFVG